MGTDFLYARPRFVSGMGMVVDLAGTMVRQYNYSRTPNAADSVALRSDWAMTGSDLQVAVNSLDAKKNGKAK
jgi:hypothetical protein